MDLGKRISQMKEKELYEIEHAAKHGNVTAVVSHTKTVETLEKLQQQLQQISSALEAILRGIDNIPARQISPSISPKERGRIRREEFVNEVRERGKKVNHLKGQLYEIGGKVVGVAYASERAPNKWFLGLPKQDYGCLVLLCENDSGKIKRLIFPKAFYQKHRDLFSVDKAGQLKFNVNIRGEHCTMKIPRLEDIHINDYVDAFNNL